MIPRVDVGTLLAEQFSGEEPGLEHEFLLAKSPEDRRVNRDININRGPGPSLPTVGMETEYIATLKPADARSLRRAEWIELILSHPKLRPQPQRLGVNPFTNQEQIFKGAETNAIIVDNDSEIGELSWDEYPDESALWISVCAVPQRKDKVLEIADEVAQRLSWDIEYDS